MKNQDILSCYEGLQNLRKAAIQRVPARVSFAIVRNIKILQPIVEDLQSVYNELVLKYANPIEEDRYQIKDGLIGEFNKEITNLYTQDTEVAIVKIKFSDIENLMLSLDETEALYFMVEEDEEA